MGRFLRRTAVVLTAFWLALGVLPGVAQASVDNVTLSPQSACLTAGARVINQTGADIHVRVDLDGAPAFSGDPMYTVANGPSGTVLTGAAPVSGPGVYSYYLVHPDDTETLIGTVTYAEPGYCDDFTITYDDRCETVTATVTNHHGAAATISFVKVSGATSSIGSLTVADGQTASIDLPIMAAVHDIGAYLDPPGDYLNKVPVKGVGLCPTPVSPTSPAPTNLASTGNPSLVPVTVAGVALILCGVLVIIVLRRVRFR